MFANGNQSYFLSIASCFALMFAGCVMTTVTHPVLDPERADVAEALYGTFRGLESSENGSHWVHVAPAGKKYPEGFLRIISVVKGPDGELGALSVCGFVAAIGDHFVLHVPWPATLDDISETKGDRPFWNQPWQSMRVGSYLLMRITIVPDGVKVADLNDDFLVEQIAAGHLAGSLVESELQSDTGTETRYRPGTIEAATDELRSFVEKHIDGGLFANEVEFKRME